VVATWRGDPGSFSPLRIRRFWNNLEAIRFLAVWETFLYPVTAGMPVIREEPVLASGSCQWRAASWPVGMRRLGRIRKTEMANITTGAVSARTWHSRAGCSEGRSSGESHQQKREAMNSTKKTARIAGLLYLVNGVTGFFSIIYVPSRLIVSGNAAATANNILASERLFRLGIVSELICAAEFVFLLWVLYRLLGAVNKTHASLMVILGLLQIPIMFVNTLNEIAALSLLRRADFLSVFDQPQRQALAMQFLNLHAEGFGIAGIFWGLWLFPFGILVFRSGFLPRILGVLLIAACFGYLADSLTSLLLPSYEDVVGRIGSPTSL
jgi:uncharacterized protein DUF4386